MARRAQRRHVELAPGRDGLAVDGEHEVSRLDARGGRRRAGVDPRHLGPAVLGRRHLHADHEGERRRTARRPRCWRPGPPGGSGSGASRGRSGSGAAASLPTTSDSSGPEPVDADVAAERDQAHPVVGPAALGAEEPLAEADGEHGHPCGKARGRSGSARPREGGPGPRGPPSRQGRSAASHHPSPHREPAPVKANFAAVSCAHARPRRSAARASSRVARAWAWAVSRSIAASTTPGSP